MRIEDAITYARNLADRLGGFTGENLDSTALHAAKQIIGEVVGRDSDLYRGADMDGGMYRETSVLSSLRAMIEMHDGGLLTETSLRRQAQSDVLADILDQAAVLLDKRDFHPMAPAVLAGGALEQFLRSWVEEKRLPMNAERPTINDYAGALRAADLIDKGDKKDIDAWADLRNKAAHGELGSAQTDRDRVRIMMDGVGLFFRKHDARARGSA